MLDFRGTQGLRMTSVSRDFILNNFPSTNYSFSVSRKKEVLQYLMFSPIVIWEADVAVSLKIEL